VIQNADGSIQQLVFISYHMQAFWYNQNIAMAEVRRSVDLERDWLRDQ